MKVLCFLSCHHNTKAELFFIFKPPNQKRIIAWECLKQQKGRRKSRKCGEISTVNLFAVDVFISQCFVRLFVCAQTSSQAFKMRSHYLWGPSLLDGIWVSRKIVIRNKVCLCFYRSKCLQMMRQLMSQFHRKVFELYTIFSLPDVLVIISRSASNVFLLNLFGWSQEILKWWFFNLLG